MISRAHMYFMVMPVQMFPCFDQGHEFQDSNAIKSKHAITVPVSMGPKKQKIIMQKTATADVEKSTSQIAGTVNNLLENEMS